MELKVVTALFGLALLSFSAVDSLLVQDYDGCVWDIEGQRLTVGKDTFWKRCVYNCTLDGKLVLNKKMLDMSRCQVLGTGDPLPPTIGVCRNGKCAKR
uniref:BTSP n=1 Tax=Argas monolakensis TaxID=34602 RepID=Q09JV4_ARGMO|nr:BTSP [Argas monolakensis]